jgi:hypothetical protein
LTQHLFTFSGAEVIVLRAALRNMRSDVVSKATAKPDSAAGILRIADRAVEELRDPDAHITFTDPAME